MKRKTFILTLAAAALLSGGCNWLDVDPELGMTEQDVYGTYKNFKAFFQHAYYATFNSADGTDLLSLTSPLNIDKNDLRFSFVGTTDAADNGRYMRAHTMFKAGVQTQETLNSFSFSTASDKKPIAWAMFKIIRICCNTIAHIDMLQNAKDTEKEDLLGQAYFMRGYAYLVLVRYYGGMPYLDTALSGDDDWDLPRLSASETLHRAADDMYEGYVHLEKAGKMRRDPRPGMPGNLTGSELDLPNGCAALALRARALVYAASPLNNEQGMAEWEEAAEACALAVSEAEKWGWVLVSFDEWKHNFIERNYTNENIWSHTEGSYVSRGVDYSAFYAKPQVPQNSKAAGTCPTQNFVDKFETAWGDPLNTEEDRRVAEERGHYNPQAPYDDLDPRFYQTIIYDGCPTPYTEAVNIYYDAASDSWPATTFETKSGPVKSSFGYNWFANPTDAAAGISYTGYYCYKYWKGELGTKDAAGYIRTDPLIRMAEVYLNYAEAVNEAYGPTGKVPGAYLTAVDAVNLVRQRAGMPDVLDELTADRETFRERIRNERNVELAYESNHYYFDIRRWKEAPVSMTRPVTGMWIEKVPVSEAYPKGRRYTRRTLPEARQSVWRDYMYWLPFPDNQANTMTRFVNNPKWQ